MKKPKEDSKTGVSEQPLPGAYSASLTDDLAAEPNPSSIMSAPRDAKKNTSFIVIACLSLLLIVSVILNFVFIGMSISRGTEIERLNRDLKDTEDVITDLKERLHEL